MKPDRYCEQCRGGGLFNGEMCKPCNGIGAFYPKRGKEDLIDRLARMSNLTINDEEKPSIAKDLLEIIKYVSCLDEALS